MPVAPARPERPGQAPLSPRAPEFPPTASGHHHQHPVIHDMPSMPRSSPIRVVVSIPRSPTRISSFVPNLSRPRRSPLRRTCSLTCCRGIREPRPACLPPRTGRPRRRPVTCGRSAHCAKRPPGVSSRSSCPAGAARPAAPGPGRCCAAPFGDPGPQHRHGDGQQRDAPFLASFLARSP